MSFKREGDDKSQLNILKVTVTVYFSALLERLKLKCYVVMVSILLTNFAS